MCVSGERVRWSAAVYEGERETVIEPLSSVSAVATTVFAVMFAVMLAVMFAVVSAMFPLTLRPTGPVFRDTFPVLLLLSFLFLTLLPTFLRIVFLPLFTAFLIILSALLMGCRQVRSLCYHTSKRVREGGGEERSD